MATAKLIGTDDASSSYFASGVVLVGSKFTASASGSMIEFRIKAYQAGHIKPAIYADSGGEPGARLGYDNTSYAVSVGWNTISFPATNLTPGTDYWLFAASEYRIVSYVASGVARYKTITYSTFTFPDPAGGGFSSSPSTLMYAGWGIKVISPPGLSQPIAYGEPTVTISGIVISPQGIAVIVSYGTPTVQVGEPPLFIYPAGLQVVIAYGTPSLRYPQTISPPGLSVPIAYGTPSIVIMGEGVIYVPGHQQPIAYGVPSLLKYVWHAILDGRYSTGTLEVNRAYVIGRDSSGNPVYGTAVDSTELGLVGERLDFQQELAIPTEAQAQEVANAILSKLGLTGKSGVILIPPNCGQELFDVVQVTDSRGNQSAAKYRVVGLRFEYNPRQARYHHKLILGGP